MAMEINTFAQTLFYFVSSITIIVVGAFLAVIFYHLVKVIKNLEIFSTKLNETSDVLRENISNLGNKLSNLPLVSWIMQFIQKKESKKGRNKNNSKHVKE